MTAQADLFYRFGVALVIGILMGLEREYAAEGREAPLFAGVRTFALLSLLGCTGALISDIMGSPWPLVAVIISMGALTVAAYFSLTQSGDFGGTSEVASLLAILLGALCYWDQLALAAALAVAATVLLSLKRAMQNFARHLSRDDVLATLKFAVISAIILPILPNRTFGPPPFDALNPFRIWLMVVFISGISFTGYVLMKLVNVRHGIGLTGILGGLVSSTAVTMSFSQRSRTADGLARPFALAITISWAMMFLRVLLEVGVLNARLAWVLWAPLLVTGLLLGLYAALLFFRRTPDGSEGVHLDNPFELRPALAFGMLFALVLLISRAAEYYLGSSGLYLSSLAAGLADVNAITLTMAELSARPGGIEVEVAARSVLLAVLSNTVAKSVMVAGAGSRSLRWAMAPSAIIGILASGVFAYLI
jgi:uncharacterized membrane protein (DUF4010 family)